MTQTERLLIAKLEELIIHIRGYFPYYASHDEKQKLLESDISQLEQQVEEEEKPEFDKNYLNECIEKATPNLSKIKDADRELDEIRGIGEKIDEARLKEELIKFMEFLTIDKYQDNPDINLIDEYLKNRTNGNNTQDIH